MLAALTLCLGLQSGFASAVPAAGTRALHVFIEGEDGTLLVDGWSVRLGRLSGTTMRWHETARVDGTSGIAEFAAIDEPTNFVQAVHDTGEHSRCELVRFGPLAAGALADVHRLVCDGPTPERSIYVTVHDALGLESRGDLSLVAIDRAGREIALAPEPYTVGLHVARGVEPGGYRIELRNPRYLPLLLERHTTGRAATVQPIGSATLVVTFVDAVDGRALTPVDVTSMTSVESRSGRTLLSASAVPMGASSAAPAGEARLAGLVPGTHTWIHATFPRHFAASLDVADLAPDETRRITQRVERARSMRGTIVDAAGVPVAGVPVAGVPAATAGGASTAGARARPRSVLVTSGTMSLLHGRGGPGVVTALAARTSLSTQLGRANVTALSATCVSDDAGRFELHGLGNGPTQLEAQFTPWHREALTLPALTASRPTGRASSPERASSIDEVRAGAELEEAPPLVVRAPGPCGADLQFVVPRGTTLAHYEVSLQLGDAPWLLPKDRVAPLVDENEVMKLRGLTGAPCRLDVRLRDGSVWPPVPDTAPSSLTVEFVPDAGAPTRVRVDLGPLAGDQ